MQKLWSDSHFTSSGNGSGTGERVYSTGPGTGDIALYRIALVVPVPVRNSVPVGS